MMNKGEKLVCYSFEWSIREQGWSLRMLIRLSDLVGISVTGKFRQLKLLINANSSFLWGDRRWFRFCRREEEDEQCFSPNQKREEEEEKGEERKKEKRKGKERGREWLRGCSRQWMEKSTAALPLGLNGDEEEWCRQISLLRAKMKGSVSFKWRQGCFCKFKEIRGVFW
uniref:Uncharacterized protein n=1 Tax=Nelumbo nucifera TaxID=4432 RepID=A0A822XZB2_NELNU|nr:TPA_asm: hypothetical protein HUJ06_025800 [Nelumbo nucifera]